MSTTRVVYNVESNAFGGVERHLVTLVEHLARRRFEPMVLGRAPETVLRALARVWVGRVESRVLRGS